METTKNEEVFNVFMFLKEKNILPHAESHFCDTRDVPPLQISILKLKTLGRSMDTLQAKYSTLTDACNKPTTIDVADSVRSLCQKLLTLHQRRIEATTYTITHLTTNLGRMAGR